MSRILLTCMVLASVLVADELKMKDVNRMLYEAENKILIIDKKDLDGFIAENNKKAEAEADAKAKERMRAKVPDEVFLNLGTQTIVDSTPSREQAPLPETKKMVEKKVFSVDSLEKYKEFISLQKKSEFDVRYALKIRELLEVTKYVFHKNIDKEYFPEIKSLLLSEMKSNKKIDQKVFAQALNEMNYDIATEMLNEFSSLEES